MSTRRAAIDPSSTAGAFNNLKNGSSHCRPQTNGKVGRFHRILLEEWAYIRHWDTEVQRHHAYTGFIHFYNHHRPHGSLHWATPISILKDNLTAEHN